MSGFVEDFFKEFEWDSLMRSLTMEIEELHVTWDDIIHLLPQLIIGLLFFIKPNMEHEEWITLTKANMERADVTDFIQTKGLALSDSSDDSAVISLATIFVQYASDVFYTSGIGQALEKLEFSLEQKGHFLRRLKGMKQSPSNETDLATSVRQIRLFLLQLGVDLCRIPSTVVCYSRRGIYTISDKSPSAADGKITIWQDPKTGLFSCIVPCPWAFEYGDDYIDPLINELSCVQDFFRRLFDAGDYEQFESTVDDCTNGLQRCHSVRDYLTQLETFGMKDDDQVSPVITKLAAVDLSAAQLREFRDEMALRFKFALEDSFSKRKHSFEVNIRREADQRVQRHEKYAALKATMTRRQDKIHHLEKKAEEHKAQIAQFYWDKFRIKLSESEPSLKVVQDGLSIDPDIRPDQLIDLIIETFDLHFEERELHHLRSVALENAAACAKMQQMAQEILNRSYTVLKSKDFWAMSASCILLSEVIDQLADCTFPEIHVCASHIIYVDCDWIVHGRSVALSAPKICVDGVSHRIVTSGQDAPELPQRKADDARREGENGDDGAHGAAGGSAGHVSINCDVLIGARRSLNVEANGGRGGAGQDGGRGADGRDGKDGVDGSAEKPLTDFALLNIYVAARDKLLVMASGSKGEAGKAGGSGGAKGLGGQGGKNGRIQLNISTGRENFTCTNHCGQDGADGKPGNGGAGGRGGRHGMDEAWAFKPKSVVTGEWRRARGKLETTPIMWGTDFCVGYELKKIGEDYGTARDGQDGCRGRSVQSERNRASAVKEMAPVQHMFRSYSAKGNLTDLESELEIVERSLKDERESLQQCVQQEETIDRMEQMERRIKLIDVGAEGNQRATTREQRVGVLEANETKEGKINEFLQVPTVQPVFSPQTETLDSLAWNYFKDPEMDAKKALVLASLTQQIAMQISVETWSAVTSIANEFVNDIDSLLESLRDIVADAALVRLIELKNAQCVIESIRQAVSQGPATDSTRVMYLFRRRSFGYQDIRNIVDLVERVVSHPDVVAELKNALSSRLLDAALALKWTKEDIEKTDIQVWLQNVVRFCVREPSTGMASFFDELVDKLMKVKNIGELKSTVSEFVLHKLGLDQAENCLNADATTVEFIVQHMTLSPHQLDKFPKEAKVFPLIIKTFAKCNWDPKWLSLQNQLVGKFGNNVELQNTLNELKRVMECKYCRLSFTEKMAVCSEIGKMSEKDETKLMKKVSEQLKNISGHFDDEAKTHEEAMIEFFRKLKEHTMKKAPPLKRKLKHFPSFNDFLQPMKRVVFVYDQLNLTVDQFRRLEELIKDIQIDERVDKSFKQLWQHFKEMHQQWASKYLERWLHRFDEAVEQIVKIKGNVLRTWKESECRHEAVEPAQTLREMEILLSKFELFTSHFLTPTEALEQWQCLERTKLIELDEEIKRRLNENEGIIYPSAHQRLQEHNTDTSSENIITPDILTYLKKDVDQVLLKAKAGDYSNLTAEIQNMQISLKCQVLGQKERDDLNKELTRWEQKAAEVTSSPISSQVTDLMTLILSTISNSDSLLLQLKSSAESNRLQFQECCRSLHDTTSQTLAAVKEIDGKQDSSQVTSLFGHLEDERVTKLCTIREKLNEMRAAQLQMLTARYSNGNNTTEASDWVERLLHAATSGDKLALKVAAQLCATMNPTDVETVKKLSRSLNPLFQPEVHIKKIQTCLINFFDELNYKQWKQSTDQGQWYEERAFHLRIVSRFYGQSDVQTNQLYLEGLEQLDPRAEESIRQSTWKFIKRKSEVKSVPRKKLNILEFLYDSQPNSNDDVENACEWAFLQRWIQSNTAKTKANINDINKLMTNPREACRNRFWQMMDDVMTDDERKYLRMLEPERANYFLRNENPENLLHAIREEIIIQIYQSLVRLYYPQPVAEVEPLLQSYQQTDQPQELNEEIRDVLVLRKNFKRAIFFARQQGIECEWITWMKDVVLKSLSTCRISMMEVSRFLFAAEEFSFELLLKITLTTRPFQWVDALLFTSIRNAATDLYGQPTNLLDLDLLAILQRCQQGPQILTALRYKLREEAALINNRDNNLETLKAILSSLKELDHIDNVATLGVLPLKQWPRRIRYFQLAREWKPELASLMLTLDSKLQVEGTDRFLSEFKTQFQKNEEKLEEMLKLLIRCQWLLEEMSPNINWQLIDNERRTDENADLTAQEIVNSLQTSVQQSVVKELFDSNIFCWMNEIKSKLKDKSNWTVQDITSWSQNNKANMTPTEFLAVACQAVYVKNNFYPRDTQLVAVLIYIGSLNRQRSCMAQISTGEGKTLITALLALYGAFKGSPVNVITSSPVLAEENIIQVQDLFMCFGVSVGNNCDAKCVDDDERRQRYKNDVLYGDLSSFQRDILVTRFFGRDITRNREPAVVIVDEVDSLLLDKGENILYLSHKIPEFDHLLPLFVDIWSAVHAPEVLQGSERDCRIVVDHIRVRIKRKQILVPACLSDLVERHLLTWVRNAFRAKYSVTANDSYKVEDVRDGRGQQVVVMDKETGVEQVDMHWSNGLHQFLQLKHGLKVSPLSLKAIFMSNISYFNQYKGKIYGLTGTLGSQAECDLLSQVFDVDFFVMPRSKRRFCEEEDPLLSNTEDEWLNNAKQATEEQIKNNRAVLIVCDNIAAVNSIAARLSRDNPETSLRSLRTYTSSFDKEFQRHQQEHALEPGEVIVATNLAGRGTDLRISDSLDTNGGLHVIVSYLPSNGRVEAQAQGRTARAGQRGSFQFILFDPDVDPSADVYCELQRLKMKRDDLETKRLEHFRKTGLQKIRVEEELFNRFQREIFDRQFTELDKTMQSKGLKGYKVQGKDYRQLQLNFLTNQFALWLDAHGSEIEEIHPKSYEIITAQFDDFKNKCSTSENNGLIRFASTPSELLLLACFVETTFTDVAGKCCQQVIDGEPEFCESGLIRVAHRILQKPNVKQKEVAKDLLKAKLKMEAKIATLTVCSEVVRTLAQLSNEQGQADCENRFDQQISGLVTMYQIHLAAIEDILGRSIDRCIAIRFPNENEAETICTFLQKQGNLCKTYRLSKKVSIDAGDIVLTVCGIRRVIQLPWPFTLFQCSIVEFLRHRLGQPVQKNDLAGLMISRDRLWQMLVQEELINQVETAEKFQISETADENGLVLPDALSHLRPLLITEMKKWSGREFDEQRHLAAFGFSDEESAVVTEALKAKQFLIAVTEVKGKLSKSIQSAALSDELHLYRNLLVEWTRNKAIGDQLSPQELPCPVDVVRGSSELWNYLINEGVIKGLTLKLPKQATADQIESRVNDVNKMITSAAEIKELCECYNPVNDVQDVSMEDVKSYLLSHKWIACHLALIHFHMPVVDFSLNSFTNIVSHLTPFLEQVLEIEGDEIRQWLTKERRKKKFTDYVESITDALTSSAGHLKTVTPISATLRPLDEFFPNISCPAEVDSFEDNVLGGALVLERKNSWFDWRAFSVAMIGMSQIVAGTALLMTGMASPLGLALVAEGTFDIFFAIQAGLTKTFTWKSYAIWKSISVLITGLSAGFAHVSLAAGAAEAAGLVAARTVLPKVGRVMYKTAAVLGLDMLIQFVKDTILKYRIDQFKDSIRLESDSSLKMEQVMNAIRVAMKRAGYSLNAIKDVIDRCITLPLNNSTWSQMVTVRLRQSATVMLTNFKGVGRNWKSLTSIADGLIKLLNGKKKDQEFQSLTTEHVNNVTEELKRELHDRRTDSEQSLNDTEEEEEEFEEFKKQKMDQVWKGVQNHILIQMQAVWAEPWVTTHVTRIFRSFKKRTNHFVSSDLRAFGQGRERVSIKPQMKANRKKFLFTADLEEVTIDAELLTDEEHVALRQVDRKFGGLYELQLDNAGQLNVQPMTYVKAVDSIGRSTKLSTWIVQLIADLYGPIEVVDELENILETKTRIFTSKGKECDTFLYRLRIEGNLIQLNYEPPDLPAKTCTAGCLLEGLSLVLGYQRDEIVKKLKDYAINDHRSRYFYQHEMDSILSNLRIVAKIKTPDSHVDHQMTTENERDQRKWIIQDPLVQADFQVTLDQDPTSSTRPHFAIKVGRKRL